MDNIPVWYKRTGQKPKVGEKWIINGRVRIFFGKSSKDVPRWHCEHNKRSGRCSICKEKYPKTKPKNKSWICITCGNGGVFNLPGVRPGYYCKSCKTDEMVNVKFNACLCGKSQPSFAFPGEKKAICCGACKKEGMVDVQNPMCSCGIRATFNLPGEKKAIFCANCKTEGMVDIKNRKCLKCKIHAPNYNLPGIKTGKYCVSCKTDSMVNVTHRKCPCGIIPVFNFPGKKVGIACKTCRKEGMINVIDKTCPCGYIPHFNLPGVKPAICCNMCKKDGMVNVKCRRCPCGIQAGYNYPGNKSGICCFSCKKEGMIDVINPKCKSEFCNTYPYPSNKYKGYCSYCFQHLFPLDPLSFQSRCKTKELAVRDFINANYEGFQHDKPMYTGGCDCSVRRRLDHRKLIGNTLLVVETDENQHKRYDQMDEQIRYDDLFMAYSGKWIYIRFNPDKYHDKNNKKKNPTIATRLEKLKEELDKQIMRIENNENTELLERIYMYYDEA